MEEKKKKCHPMLKMFFLNDEDGFSARDFLLVTTMGMYFVLFIYCMVSLITDKTIPDAAFGLFSSTDAIVITVVGGTMGVVGIEKLVESRGKNDRKQSNDHNSYNREDDDII